MDSHFQPESPSDQPPAKTHADLLELSEPLQQVFRVILRQRSIAISEVAAALQQDEATVLPLLQTLVEQGFVEGEMVSNQLHYRSRLAPRRSRKLSGEIWQKLED